MFAAGKRKDWKSMAYYVLSEKVPRNFCKMDVLKSLTATKTFGEYMEISQYVANAATSVQNIEFNMSTIIALKNVRAYEIEVSFFNN